MWRSPGISLTIRSVAAAVSSAKDVWRRLRSDSSSRLRLARGASESWRGCDARLRSRGGDADAATEEGGGPTRAGAEAVRPVFGRVPFSLPPDRKRSRYRAGVRPQVFLKSRTKW